MTDKPARKKGKLKLEPELCKSCCYCVEHCPTKSLSLSGQYNSKGYYPVQWSKDKCNGCAICATMCPEAAIEVWRE